MKFHENLQRLRKESGLSQEEVARQLFLSRQSVSKWENGGAEPGIENLKALAKLYSVTVDELVGNIDGEEASSAEDRQETGRAYLGLVAVRIFFMLALLVFCAEYGYRASDMAYAFPDLFLMLLAIWVPHPAMWTLLMFAQLAEAVFGVAFLVTEGSFPALMAIFTNGFCAGVLYTPDLRKRFQTKL